MIRLSLTILKGEKHQKESSLVGDFKFYPWRFKITLSKMNYYTGKQEGKAHIYLSCIHSQSHKDMKPKKGPIS